MQGTNEERKRPASCEMSAMNSTASEEPITSETPEKCPFLEYVENNPLAAVVQALAIGFAVGMLMRLIEGTKSREPEIDVKRKPTLDEAKFHLGSVLLPFIWPAWRIAQEGYGKSAESLQETLEKIKTTDLTKEGKKHLKKVEEWAEREAEHLSEVGKGKAKTVEKWVEDEILPAAECGWKKLRKLLG